MSLIKDIIIKEQVQNVWFRIDCWFTDLQDCIPKELRNLWYYSLVLNKLAKHGLGNQTSRTSYKQSVLKIESSSKLSVYQFIKVLGELRDWEICSPDITAAIEFCREKIVDMTVEDFEEWFHQQFPTVLRPPTVIPTKNKDKKRSIVSIYTTVTNIQTYNYSSNANNH